MSGRFIGSVSYAIRFSLAIGLIGVAVSFVLGCLLGGISGYYGGVPDLIIQRIIEFLISIPVIPFWMGLAAALALAVPNMILGETALSFLGLGLQPPVVSWGVLLQDAQNLQSLANYSWLLIPGLFVVASVLAFNFVGDGLRAAADRYR